jgi:hypothetical protein
MDEQKTEVHYVGGPKDGDTYTLRGPQSEKIVFPTLPPKWTETVYHRTDRTDAAGRLVYEYRG